MAEKSEDGGFFSVASVSEGPGLLQEENNKLPRTDTRSGSCTSRCPCQALPELMPQDFTALWVTSSASQAIMASCLARPIKGPMFCFVFFFSGLTCWEPGEEEQARCKQPAAHAGPSLAAEAQGSRGAASFFFSHRPGTRISKEPVGLAAQRNTRVPTGTAQPTRT